MADAAGAVAAAALVLTWLAVQNEGTRSAIPGVNAGPKLVSQAQLEAFAKTTARTLVLTGRITPVDADAGSA